MPEDTFTAATVVLPTGVQSENWTAWINKMPPPPDELHVRGEVIVGNPGVDVYLFKTVPQGINPDILLLDLVLVQQPGIWIPKVTKKTARYEEVGASLAYSSVSILSGGTSITQIDVTIVQ